MKNKNTWAHIFLLSIGWGLIPSALAQAADETDSKVGDFDDPIIINNEPIMGRPVLPANDTTFRFKLKDTGNVIEMRWSQLDEAERKRVQKLFGLTVVDSSRKMGEKIAGVILHLHNGKQIEGMPLPERDRGSCKAFRTSTIPYMTVYEKDIKETEITERYESDFFSPREIYDRMMLEKPPGNDDAAAHLAMAKKCGNMELYKEAIEHLKISEIIDPRSKERNEDDRKSLIAEHARKEGKKLYSQLMTFYRGQEFFSAKSILDKLDRNFPNHEDRSRWDTIRQDITAGCTTMLTKQVIQSSYSIMTDLIQEKYSKKIKLDEKGNVVASIPGKQVTTRQSDIFRGTIIDPNVNGNMVMKISDSRAGEMTLKISIKDIMSVQDVDLSVGSKSVAPLFDDLKEYVTDKGSVNGLKGQMLARIAQQTGTPLAKVKEIFDGRMDREASYEGGKLVKSPLYVTDHVAHYDVGSWLRKGARILAAPQPQQATPNGAPAEDNNPEQTDDPMVWWKFQRSDVHMAVLKALACESVFAVTDVDKLPCKNCGNKGVVQQTTGAGRVEEVRCPVCRGQGILYKIHYH